MSTKKPTPYTIGLKSENILPVPKREFEHFIGLTPDERKEINDTLFRATDQGGDNTIALRNFFGSLKNAVSNYKTNHDALALGLELAALLNNTPDEIIARNIVVCGILHSIRRKLNEKHDAHGTPAPVKDSAK